MQAQTAVAKVASLVSEPSRASMLTALMDGRHHPAGDLAYMAGVKPQTASFHLQKMAEAGVVSMHKQGRHRYYSIASPEIAQVLELLLTISPPMEIKSFRQSVQDQAMRSARTCYDHLAGAFGVQLTAALLQQGWIAENDSTYTVTEQGTGALEDFGIDLSQARRKRRAFAPRCLDWSERRYHLAGALGAAVLDNLLERGWVTRQPQTRAVKVTPAGVTGLAAVFPMSFQEKE
ncbi:putative HTH-type transcriptional regulator YdfF [Paenibacillus albidus]|uniref:HTH-type transcriptional regulator YdfF n=1 Tax=Paenibacillus albidus TaxID=2041023 RepID=A0A917C5A1_9BACL|nr:helix-turn-helix transcriptional regulator [Paenibacillus albidus]GGF69649.1 putative HTH-type transcriptional regulator YdfF [Paenibacillus albidus]